MSLVVVSRYFMCYLRATDNVNSIYSINSHNPAIYIHIANIIARRNFNAERACDGLES